jgi:hypothetical protein
VSPQDWRLTLTISLTILNCFRLRCYQLDNGRSTAVLRCYKVHALQVYS